MDVAHGQGNPILGFFPGEQAHFGFRREHRRLHGDGVRVGRDIVGQDQNLALAATHEIPRHGEEEVGVGASTITSRAARGDQVLVAITASVIGLTNSRVGSSSSASSRSHCVTSAPDSATVSRTRPQLIRQNSASSEAP